MCVGTLQMSIRKHLKYWGGDKSEMTMCWHLINLRVDIHPSITKPKAKSFYADWLIICTVTCVQIIIPKHQKESTSESISFGDALESSRGNLGQHRKLFTSSIHSGAEFASIQSQTQGFLQSWIWFPRCLSRGLHGLEWWRMARKERTRNFTGGHSSPYKTEGQRLCSGWQTATCVQIVNPKYQKKSTSESILFRDAVESSKGHSGRQREPFTSSFPMLNVSIRI